MYKFYFYCTNCRHIDCLSLPCATKKTKNLKEEKKVLHFKKKNKKNQKKGNIQSQHKVLMLRGSHKK